MKQFLVTEEEFDQCNVILDHGGYFPIVAEELPPNALVLNKGEFVQKYIDHSESPFAKEDARELWAKLGGK